MENKSFVSISELTKEEILSLLDDASYFERNPRG